MNKIILIIFLLFGSLIIFADENDFKSYKDSEKKSYNTFKNNNKAGAEAEVVVLIDKTFSNLYKTNYSPTENICESTDLNNNQQADLKVDEYEKIRFKIDGKDYDLNEIEAMSYVSINSLLLDYIDELCTNANTEEEIKKAQQEINRRLENAQYDIEKISIGLILNSETNERFKLASDNFAKMNKILVDMFSDKKVIRYCDNEKDALVTSLMMDVIKLQETCDEIFKKSNDKIKNKNISLLLPIIKKEYQKYIQKMEEINPKSEALIKFQKDMSVVVNIQANLSKIANKTNNSNNPCWTILEDDKSVSDNIIIGSSVLVDSTGERFEKEVAFYDYLKQQEQDDIQSTINELIKKGEELSLLKSETLTVEDIQKVQEYLTFYTNNKENIKNYITPKKERIIDLLKKENLSVAETNELQTLKDQLSKFNEKNMSNMLKVVKKCSNEIKDKVLEVYSDLIIEAEMYTQNVIPTSDSDRKIFYLNKANQWNMEMSGKNDQKRNHLLVGGLGSVEKNVDLGKSGKKTNHLLAYRDDSDEEVFLNIDANIESQVFVDDLDDYLYKQSKNKNNCIDNCTEGLNDWNEKYQASIQAVLKEKPQVDKNKRYIKLLLDRLWSKQEAIQKARASVEQNCNKDDDVAMIEFIKSRYDRIIDFKKICQGGIFEPTTLLEVAIGAFKISIDDAKASGLFNNSKIKSDYLAYYQNKFDQVNKEFKRQTACNLSDNDKKEISASQIIEREKWLSKTVEDLGKENSKIVKSESIKGKEGNVSNSTGKKYNVDNKSISTKKSQTLNEVIYSKRKQSLDDYLNSYQEAINEKLKQNIFNDVVKSANSVVTSEANIKTELPAAAEAKEAVTEKKEETNKEVPAEPVANETKKSPAPKTNNITNFPKPAINPDLGSALPIPIRPEEKPNPYPAASSGDSSFNLNLDNASSKNAIRKNPAPSNTSDSNLKVTKVLPTGNDGEGTGPTTSSAERPVTASLAGSSSDTGVKRPSNYYETLATPEQIIKNLALPNASNGVDLLYFTPAPKDWDNAYIKKNVDENSPLAPLVDKTLFANAVENLKKGKENKETARPYILCKQDFSKDILYFLPGESNKMALENLAKIYENTLMKEINKIASLKAALQGILKEKNSTCMAFKEPPLKREDIDHAFVVTNVTFKDFIKKAGIPKSFTDLFDKKLIPDYRFWFTLGHGETYESALQACKYHRYFDHAENPRYVKEEKDYQVKLRDLVVQSKVAQKELFEKRGIKFDTDFVRAYFEGPKELSNLLLADYDGQTYSKDDFNNLDTYIANLKILNPELMLSLSLFEKKSNENKNALVNVEYKKWAALRLINTAKSVGQEIFDIREIENLHNKQKLGIKEDFTSFNEIGKESKSPPKTSKAHRTSFKKGITKSIGNSKISGVESYYIPDIYVNKESTMQEHPISAATKKDIISKIEYAQKEIKDELRKTQPKLYALLEKSSIVFDVKPIQSNSGEKKIEVKVHVVGASGESSENILELEEALNKMQITP